MAQPDNSWFTVFRHWKDSISWHLDTVKLLKNFPELCRNLMHIIHQHLGFSYSRKKFKDPSNISLRWFMWTPESLGKCIYFLPYVHNGWKDLFCFKIAFPLLFFPSQISHGMIKNIRIFLHWWTPILWVSSACAGFALCLAFLLWYQWFPVSIWLSTEEVRNCHFTFFPIRWCIFERLIHL